MMSNFDVVPVYNKDRFLFQSIMEDFISRGFFFTNMITEESKKEKVLGFFLKEIQ